MTTQELADRMGVTAVAVAKAETSERDRRIKLGTLDRVAGALGCDVVYALVPRSSLQAMVRDQAEFVARQEFAGLTNTMALEAQSLTDQDARDAFDDLVDRVATARGLWRVDS